MNVILLIRRPAQAISICFCLPHTQSSGCGFLSPGRLPDPRSRNESSCHLRPVVTSPIPPLSSTGARWPVPEKRLAAV